MINLIKEAAAAKLKCCAQGHRMVFLATCVRSTSGPHGGVGGRTMTAFQVYAFRNKGTGNGMLYCNGVWARWKDTRKLGGWR